MTPNPMSQCTPSHCTWAELGGMYSSPAFLLGAVILVAAAALFLSSRTRRYGWVLVPVLIVVGFIGMGMHPASGA